MAWFYSALDNLASALAIECGELQETMLWKTDEEVTAMISQPETRQSLAEEIADVLIYALLLSAQTQIDPEASVVDKLAKNRIRYPATLAKGNAKKYTEFPP